MANEVLIIEARRATGMTNGVATSILGEILTTQTEDIASSAVVLDTSTEVVRIISKGTGFWFKTGDSTVSAVADTDGNIWLGADKEIDLEVKATNGKKHFTYIDTAADA